MDFEYVLAPALILLIGIAVVCFSVRRVRSLPAKVSSKSRRIIERVVFAVIILEMVTVAASASYNAIALAWFRAHNPPPGSDYLANGHQMHMNCTGSGSPTIVLEAGLGNDALIWGGVQPELAKTTHVCAYDRAGFGWSDALAGPRDADHIAAELHGLLLEAKVSGPIVLMGHSIAGIYMRDYATRYPADIAGIVFVDGSTPLQDESPAMKAMTAKRPPQWATMLFQRAVYAVGVPRLMRQCSQRIPGFDANASQLLAEDICHLQIGALIAESDGVNRSGHQAVHTGPYGALPILIFSEDPAKMAASTSADLANTWNQMQENLKSLSTRSRRIIAKGSSHYVQIDRPELIEKEVPLFIEQIRGTAPQPTNYGSTITE